MVSWLSRTLVRFWARFSKVVLGKVICGMVRQDSVCPDGVWHALAI